MRLLKAWVYVFSSLLLLTACNSKQEATQKPKFSESKLYKIDKNIALTKLLFDTQKTTSCFMASRRDKLSSSKIGVQLEKILAEDAAVCSLYKAAELNVARVFQIIEDSGKVNSELYFFTIFISSFDEKENSIYKDELVGLFDSKQDCEKVRKIAIESDIPNKVCKKFSGNPFLE